MTGDKKVHIKTNPIIFSLLLFIGCVKPLEGWNKYVHSKDALKAQEAITGELLNKHISTLSSDKYEGRFPGTIGEELTVEYLSKTYSALGLKPGNPDGSWIQKATMTGIISEVKAQFITDDERWVMKLGRDIVGNSFQTKESVNINNTDVIFDPFNWGCQVFHDNVPYRRSPASPSPGIM